MKRICFFLTVILFLSLSACSSITPQPVIDRVPLAPAITETPPARVVELATPTLKLNETEKASMPQSTKEAVKPTAEPTLDEKSINTTATAAALKPPANVPPLDSSGWQRVGEGLPFTFELPRSWAIPEGMRFIWAPVGLPISENGMFLGVNIALDPGDIESQLLPKNMAVESRSKIDSNGVSYEKIQLKIFNWEDNSVLAYETHVIIRTGSTDKAYGMYVTARTAEARAGLEEVLTHAVETLAFAQ